MGDRSTTLQAVIDTQMIGILRVIVTMPVEHLLDRLKTHMQTKMSDVSPMKSLVEVYKERGIIRGFYAGFSPSLIRCILKQYYRWPMMILIPNFYHKHVQSPLAAKTLTGITIGLFESVIICPLERLKTIYMTRLALTSGKATTFIIFQVIRSVDYSTAIKQTMFAYLYTGFAVQTTRQIVSWTSFLYWDHRIRYAFKGGDRTQKLTGVQVVVSAFLSSILNISMVHPFDTIKTLYQMEENTAYRNKRLHEVFRDTYRQYGLKGLYSGWQMRICTFFGQACITTPVMDYLERSHGKY